MTITTLPNQHTRNFLLDSLYNKRFSQMIDGASVQTVTLAQKLTLLEIDHLRTQEEALSLTRGTSSFNQLVENYNNRGFDTELKATLLDVDPQRLLFPMLASWCALYGDTRYSI